MEELFKISNTGYSRKARISVSIDVDNLKFLDEVVAPELGHNRSQAINWILFKSRTLKQWTKNPKMLAKIQRQTARTLGYKSPKDMRCAIEKARKKK